MKRRSNVQINPTEEGVRVTISVEGAGTRTLHAIGETEAKALKTFEETFPQFCGRFDFEKVAYRSSLKDLDLPGRAANALDAAGITMVADVPRSMQMLCAFEGMGKTSAKETLKILEGHEEPSEPDIGTLGLSGRTFGALYRADIWYVSQIPNSEEALQAIDGLGQKGINEILNAIN